MNEEYKNLIDILTRSYIFSKREVSDAKNGFFYRRRSEVRNSMYIVNKIEKAVESLDEKSRIIIENEVMKRRSGKWYLEYFSKATYYRSRNEAYRQFLLELEKK